MKKLKFLALPVLMGIGMGFAQNAIAVACSYGLASATVDPVLRMQQQRFNQHFAGTNVPTTMITSTTKIVTRIKTLEQLLLLKMTQSDAAFSTNMKNLSSDLQTVLKQMALGNVQASTAIASYMEQKKTEFAINDVQRKFEQPAANCLQLSAGKSFPKTARQARYNTAQNAHFVAKVSVLPDNDAERKEYEKNRNQFRQSNSELKDGDVQSSLLFGSSKGELTRGVGAEKNALGAVIDYLTGVNFVPKMASKDQDSYIEGRLYSDAQRRNASFVNLSNYVLNSIAEKHSPRTDLSYLYDLSGVTMTAEQKKNGVSLSDATDMYIKRLMSRENIQDMASASDSLKVLRGIAQNNAMSLHFAVQNLQSQEQIEAMKAAELSLLTHSILGEKAATYRQATINTATKVEQQ